MSLTHHYLEHALAASAEQDEAYSARHRGRGNIVPEINSRLKELKVLSRVDPPGIESGGDVVVVVIRVEVGLVGIHVLVGLVAP